MRRSLASSLTFALLTLSCGTLAWILGDGAMGVVYLVLFGLLLVPGLPIGFRLFGAHHAAGWIGGALIGYGLSAVVLWVPVEIGLHGWGWLPGVWSALAGGVWFVFRGATALIHLPVWQRTDTRALAAVLLLVPLLVAVPFSRIGERDDRGALRYRAYFTADFLWHTALTAELAKADPPIRNPYLSRRPLNYYWAYFVPPATIARTLGEALSVQACVTLNALGAGVLFLAAVYVTGWSVIPRAGPMAAAVVATVLAASAEGLYAVWRLTSAGRPWHDVRLLNIDAMTAWTFQGLTVDSLPRSLWYTPQHALSCALALIALIVAAARRDTERSITSLIAGIPLGLSVIFSPFLGGVFCVVFAATSIWIARDARKLTLKAVVGDAAAAIPVMAALAWCLANRTFEGAGGSLEFGISARAANEPIATVALALGPILVPAVFGLAGGWRRRYPWHGSVVALGVGLTLFFFVSLSAEPVWIGWRAGQIILVTLPPLCAAFFAAVCDSGRRGLAAAAAAAVLAVGGPTAVIDAWNAQDVENVSMGPGFRWTVVVPPDTQAAMQWIRRRTAPDAVVQMSIAPRGRETWTLVPSFGERRMAAGQPISLLHIADYDERSRVVDAMFAGSDAKEAARLARAERIDYVFIDRVERDAFGPAAAGKFEDGRFFSRVFQSGSAAVYQVR